jgi:hypothetical protein
MGNGCLKGMATADGWVWFGGDVRAAVVDEFG